MAFLPFTLIQAGTSLQIADVLGNLATLTLPTNVTLSATKVPRFAIFGRYVVIVNSPSRPITVDGSGVVRVLSPRPPATVPVTSGAAGGTLSGTYTVKQTFRIKDASGNIIAESEFGPVSNSTTISGQYLKVTNLDISPDDVSSTLVYRTTTNGSVYFPWYELDGNTQTQIQDDLSDASLSLFAAPVLGTAPDLAYIAEWRGRLWGVDKINVDDLRYTEAGKMYAWPLNNDIVVPPIGSDSKGVTGLIARREVLGVGKRNVLRQITGTNVADFRCVNLTSNVGIESQETVVVFRDTAYFLWKDGVYKWDQEGITCLSDGEGGKGNVRSWFTTDSYFNRDLFSTAFAMIDPIRNKYKLFLASADSAVIDSWVEYDLDDKTWWGPHNTAAFVPSCALIAVTANDVLQPMIGSTSAYLWKEQDTRTDGSATAINFDVLGASHNAETPDIDKYWGELSVMGVPQPTGTLAIIPRVGEMLANPNAVRSFDLTLARQRLNRLGVGKHCRLEFQENTVGQDVGLLGYEMEFFEVGRR